MKLKLTLFTALFGVVMAAMAPTATAAPPAAGDITTGSVTGTCSVGQVVDGQIASGTFAVTRFRAVGGQLLATGTLSGECTPVDSAAQVAPETFSRTVTTTVSRPAPEAVGIAQAPGEPCTILHLVLGPINLNLLGLVVTTNRIVLDITAVPGPGNLLGNLLCAIVGLLDGSAPATGLAALLNRVLAILG